MGEDTVINKAVVTEERQAATENHGTTSRHCPRPRQDEWTHEKMAAPSASSSTPLSTETALPQTNSDQGASRGDRPTTSATSRSGRKLTFRRSASILSRFRLQQTSMIRPFERGEERSTTSSTQSVLIRFKAAGFTLDATPNLPTYPPTPREEIVPTDHDVFLHERKA